MPKTQRILFTILLPLSLLSTAIEQGALTSECPYKNPFHQAVFAGDQERTISMMQTASDNVDINAKDTYGDTPLHVAIKHISNPQEMLDILLIRSNQNGERLAVWAANDQKKTPLHLAIERQLPEPFVRKIIEVWDADGSKKRYYQTPAYLRKEQLPKCTFIHGKDNEGYTPFDRAFAVRSAALVALFLEYEAEYNTPDEQGVTPFFKVIKENRRSSDTRLFDVLINHVPFDYRDQYGRTALHYAIIHHANDVIAYRLIHSNTVNAQDVDGKTPLHHAAMQTYANPIYTSLAQSVMYSLIGIGGKEKTLKIRDRSGHTALHKAVLYRNMPAVKTLVQNGASLNDPDQDGRLPLEYTFDGAACDIPELVKLGANPNAQHQDGCTPLHELLRKQQPRGAWARALLQAGARDNIQNNSGITPAMMMAAFKKQTGYDSYVH